MNTAGGERKRLIYIQLWLVSRFPEKEVHESSGFRTCRVIRSNLLDKAKKHLALSLHFLFLNINVFFIYKFDLNLVFMSSMSQVNL